MSTEPVPRYSINLRAGLPAARPTTAGHFARRAKLVAKAPMILKKLHAFHRGLGSKRLAAHAARMDRLTKVVTPATPAA